MQQGTAQPRRNTYLYTKGRQKYSEKKVLHSPCKCAILEKSKGEDLAMTTE